MRLLIYSHPVATNGSPTFGLHAFKNKLLKVALTAADRGLHVTVAAPAHYLQTCQRNSRIRYVELRSQDFIVHTGIAGDVDFHFYRQSGDARAVFAAAELCKRLIDEAPDVILVWEAAVPHLRQAFPEARIVNVMPSCFSRVPYDDLVITDPLGLFKEGYLHQIFPGQIDEFTPSNKEVLALDRLRVEMKQFFLSKDRLRDEVFRLKESRDGFRRISLLPLQVSAHYAFRKDSQFLTQFEMLEHVLATAPPDTGILATQYVNKNIADVALNADNAGYLNANYSNFLYNPSFNKLHNISQYLLPFVDSLTTFSSSLAFQAMLFEKPVTLIGDSFLAKVLREAAGNKARQDKILCFILFRYSVLFPFSIKQQDTFDRLLAPQFETSLLDLPNYEEAFFTSLRFASAERELHRDLQYLPGTAAISETIKLQVNQAELISFDVFDTLIERPLLEPKHVFAVVQERLADQPDLFPFNFLKARIEAERIAQSVLDGAREEITLADIYAILREKYELSEGQVTALLELELSVERALMVPRPLGERLYRYCCDNHKRIVYTSDMYMDRDTILQFLKKCGYSDQHKIYLSSEIGKKKKSGSMFPYILNKEAVDASAMLHIGDNILGDVKSPAMHGIATLHMRRAVDTMRDHPAYKALFGTRTFTDVHTSAIGYLIARHLFDDVLEPIGDESLFRKSAYELGYCGLGPCVTDYAIWLDRQFKANGHDRAFFIARDGRVIKEVFDIIQKSGVQSTYAWGSRRLLRGATVSGIADFFDIIDDASAGPLDEILFDRFGHRLDGLVQSQSGASHLQKLKDAKLALPLLLEKAKDRAELLRRYCEEIGLFSAANPCVVEIGYAATIQEGYQRLTGKPLAGYYMVLLDTALGRSSPERPMFGYAGHFCQRFNFWHPLPGHSQLFETLFCSDEDTIADVRDERGQLIAVRDVSFDDFPRKILVREMHAGARDFARDAAKLWAPILDLIRPNPELGSRVLNEFVHRPNPEDAAILDGITFENGFAKQKVVHLIPPSSRYGDYAAGRIKTAWREGSDAVAGKNSAHTDTSKSEDAAIPLTEVPFPPLPLLSRLLKPVVRQFVVGMGTKKDVEKFDAHPARFFAGLSNPWYRAIGRALFLTG